jgi:hypothetical protein
MASPKAATPAALTVLLPAQRRFAGQPLGAEMGKCLARADRLPDGEGGERAQLLRHFELLPRGWPMAASATPATRRCTSGCAPTPRMCVRT